METTADKIFSKHRRLSLWIRTSPQTKLIPIWIPIVDVRVTRQFGDTAAGYSRLVDEWTIRRATGGNHCRECSGWTIGEY